MGQATLDEVISSRARLKIADLISIRPRTLRELSELTGISVQAVLKHLEKLDGLGLLAEKRVKAGGLAARKLYSIRGVHVGDFSYGDLIVVKLSKQKPVQTEGGGSVAEIEVLAEDALVQKRRIRDQTRKLGRMIDDLVDTEVRMEGLLASLKLKDEERLLLQTAFTEESLDDAEKALRLHYGVRDARMPLERVISKAKRIGKK